MSLIHGGIIGVLPYCKSTVSMQTNILGKISVK